MPADLSAIATKNTFKDRNYPIAAIIRQLYDTFVTPMISINIKSDLLVNEGEGYC